MKGHYFFTPLLLLSSSIAYGGDNGEKITRTLNNIQRELNQVKKDVQQLSESSGSCEASIPAPPPLPKSDERSKYVLITGLADRFQGCQLLIPKGRLPESVSSYDVFDIPAMMNLKGLPEQKKFFSNVDKLKQAIPFKDAKCLGPDEEIVSVKDLPDGYAVYTSYFDNLKALTQGSDKNADENEEASEATNNLPDRGDLVAFTGMTEDELCQPLISKQVLKEMKAPSIIGAHDTYDLGRMLAEGQPYEKKFFTDNLDDLKAQIPFNEAMCTGFGGTVVMMKDHKNGRKIYNEFFDNLRKNLENIGDSSMDQDMGDNADENQGVIPPPPGPAPDLNKRLVKRRS